MPATPCSNPTSKVSASFICFQAQNVDSAYKFDFYILRKASLDKSDSADAPSISDCAIGVLKILEGNNGCKGYQNEGYRGHWTKGDFDYL